MIIVGCKVLHFINDEDQKAFGYKTLWRKNTVASHREKYTLLSLCPCVTALKISLIYV